jgi:hypothetical protein
VRLARRFLIGVAATAVATMNMTMAAQASVAAPSTDQLVQRALSRAPQVSDSAPTVEVSANTGSATLKAPDGSMITVSGQGESRAHTPGKSGQVLTVLRTKKDQAVFNLKTSPGIELHGEGKGFALTRTDGAHTLHLGRIDAPWAFDANGKSLVTSYELRGNRLIQHVETTNATFPIVADPSFSLGYDWRAGVIAYWKYNRTETRELADRSYGGVQALSGLLCASVPTWAGKGVCTYLGAARYDQIAAAARTAKAQGKCMWLVTPTTNPIAHLYYFKVYPHTC